MVEYAVLLAHNAFGAGSLGANLANWASGLDWNIIALAALAVISLRMVILIFKG